MGKVGLGAQERKRILDSDWGMASSVSLGGELKQEGEGREELLVLAIAQSPPLSDSLGEPLGLGERWSLTFSCPSRALQTTPTLPPFSRLELQLASSSSPFILPPLTLPSPLLY